jgi:hypothetical protein
MSDGNPKDLRWADPDFANSEGQRELIIAIGNLTTQVMRLVDMATAKPADAIDVSDWTRLDEVDEYAYYLGIDRAMAINRLVNAALSHGLDYRR